SDMYFGGGMYGTSGMGVDYGQSQMSAAQQGQPARYWDGYSNIQLWEMAPTLAWRMNEQVKLGASLNISYQSVAFQQRMMSGTDTDGDGVGDTVGDNFDLSRSASAFGYGLSFGALYEINDQWQVGASYKTKQSFSDLEYQLAQGDVWVDDRNAQNGMSSEGEAGTYKLGLDLPQRLAIGGAWMPSEDVTVSADLKWINWSDTMDELAVEGPNGTQRTMDPGWDDQTVYALGANWGVADGVEVRAGYNYAESPIDSEDVVANMILPAVVESHYTVGAGFDLAGGWELDAHYMYVPEKTFTAPANTGATDPNNEQEIGLSETSFGINLGYRF
ncbi:MAG: OmpP1/FadL family transporter, partial [Thiohalospira sp.]